MREFSWKGSAWPKSHVGGGRCRAWGGRLGPWKDRPRPNRPSSSCSRSSTPIWRTPPTPWPDRAGAAELEKLNGKLQRACEEASEALDRLGEEAPGDLGDILLTLSANLVPVGATYQQQLTLVQLCLEEAPAELLPFTPAGAAAGSGWGKRMRDFLARLEDPAFQAQSRWSGVDPDVGDEARED